jgi:hypothetical protein
MLIGLHKAGVEKNIARAHAEVQADIFNELIKNNLATKDDIKNLRVEVHEIEYLLRTEIKLVSKNLTIRLGGTLATSIGIIVTLMTILHFH